MKKILLFIDNLEVGGIQTFILNMVKSFDENYKFDLLLLDDKKSNKLEEAYEKNGIKIFKLNKIWIKKPFDYVRYYKSINNFFKDNHDYDVIHLNSSSKNYPVLKFAKKYGIRVRIAHSHNTGFQTKNWLKIFIGNIFKKKLMKYATDLVACSDLAAIWLFGKKKYFQNEVTIVKNGINLELFRYNPDVRRQVRQQYNLDEKYVICNVGRFVNQKNHKFILDIFKEIHIKNNSAVLLLIGEGPLMEDIINYSKLLGINEFILFLGYKCNVSDFLQASDIFLMPSLYEGFPVTSIEAQASGLPCVFSDTITEHAKIIDNSKFLSLNSTPLEWANTCLSIKNNQRDCTYNILKDNGFDIISSKEIIKAIYNK